MISEMTVTEIDSVRGGVVTPNRFLIVVGITAIFGLGLCVLGVYNLFFGDMDANRLVARRRARKKLDKR